MATINRKVLDISHWNTVSDWNAVRNAGIVGIIHKATEGTGYVDDQYSDYRKRALDVGLMWGAYHFANNKNAKDQVDHFLSVTGLDDNMLYALDWEDEPNGNTMTLPQAEDFLNLCDGLIGPADNRTVLYSGNTAKEA